MFAPLSLALALAAAPLQAPGTGTIYGVVTTASSGEPLVATTVEVQGLARPIATLSDSLGRYILRDVPAGVQTLRASRFDHDPFELDVVVPAGGAVEVDLSLLFHPVELPAVIVDANRRGAAIDTTLDASAEMSMTAIRSLEATPGMIEFGLSDVMRVSPSPEPVDPGDVLYVRGTPSDLKLVYLDGAPVYSPFHLGGLISAFEPRTLERATLFLGGAPARYDGGLSYVLDLESRPGRRDAFRSVGEVDLLAANVIAEGPIGPNAGFMAGWRTVHGHGSEWLTEEALPYDYADLLGRVDLSVGESGNLSATVFWNREAVRLGAWPGHAPEAEWGNSAVSSRYRGVHDGLHIEATVAFADYRSRLPFGGPGEVVTEGVARRGRVALDIGRQLGGAWLHYGFSHDIAALTAESWTASGVPLQPWRLRSDVAGSVNGIYTDVDWRPIRPLRLRGGLRADLFTTDGSLRFAPRFMATWSLTDQAQLTLAAGRYRQLVRMTEPIVIEGVFPGEIMRLNLATLRLARASHLLVALDQELVENLRLGIEGYYKAFDGMPTGEAVRSPTAGASPTADARASGVDLWLRRNRGEITGWVAYSLGWVWALEDGHTRTDTFAGRHLLSLGLAGNVGAAGRVLLRVAYGAGLPYSAVPAPFEPTGPDLSSEMQMASVAIYDRLFSDEDSPALTGPPDTPYLRVDAEVSRAWRGRWSGRDFTVTPYLRVLNALDRRDALFFYVNEHAESRELQPIASLPFLPVLGFQWSF